MTCTKVTETNAWELKRKLEVGSPKSNIYIMAAKTAGLIFLCNLVAASAHGSMIMPPARNAIDAALPAWSHGKHPDTGTIEPYNCRCTNGTDAECNS